MITPVSAITISSAVPVVAKGFQLRGIVPGGATSDTLTTDPRFLTTAPISSRSTRPPASNTLPSAMMMFAVTELTIVVASGSSVVGVLARYEAQPGRSANCVSSGSSSPV